MICIQSEERPWGRFFKLHDDSSYKLKRIEINLGGRLSYQFHHKSSQAQNILEGTGVMTLDGEYRDYTEEEIVLILHGLKHRIENKGSQKVIFIEVQTGIYF